MGSVSKRLFESLPPPQQASQAYYDTVARGAFRELSVNATFAPLGSVACSSVCFTNTSGKTIGVRRGGAGVVIKLPNNSGKVFDVKDNADELQIQNADDNTAAVVQYECGGEGIGN